MSMSFGAGLPARGEIGMGHILFGDCTAPGVVLICSHLRAVRDGLPEREAVCKQDPLYEIFEAQRRQLDLPFESLQQNKQKWGDAADPRFSNEADE
jgi:hypothetical protein